MASVGPGNASTKRVCSVAGVRSEDYATMMDVLQRMIANFEQVAG
ncbi:hypothetical protein [Rhodococcus sp. NPDC059234]